MKPHQPVQQPTTSLARYHAFAVLLLLLFFAQLAISVHRQSLSWDEGDHIFAGYQSWRTADFGLNPEHPPLVKAIATLPLLAMHLKTPPLNRYSFFKDEAYFDGRDLIYGNGGLATASKIIFRARMMASVFSLVMAALVYLFALELFGPLAALFALVMVVFEPNLIAHGAYVTTDMAVTCGIFASIYALFRFREHPSAGRLATLGLSTGLALAGKHSAVLLLPIALVLLLVELLRPKLPETRRFILRQYAIAFAGAGALGLLILWSTYHFRFSAHPHGSMNPGLVQYMSSLHGVEPAVYQLLARWHILPESYLYGMVDIRIQSVAGQSFPTYLFGQVHAHGVPFYFPAAFVIKSTLGFLLLLLLATWAVLSGKLAGWQRLAFLLVPPLVYLLIAIRTGLNIGARHILPMYPFLIVLIAGAAVTLWRQSRAWVYVTLLLLVWHIGSSLRSAPNYIAHANELFGGPDDTYKYLTDSNTDWGQQLLSVKSYLDQHQIHDCWFGYFVQPFIDYRDYGIPCRELPTADTVSAHHQIDTPRTISGTILVSASDVTGYEFGSVILSPFQPFMHVTPDDVIDHGVFVYHGTFDTHLAAGLGLATRATAALTKQDLPAALAAAQGAVTVAPDLPQAQIALGDTLAALHRDPEANTAYNNALTLTNRMERSAKADWQHTLTTKQNALHL